MKKSIDIASWKRKAHYEFFKSFDEPFYGLCVNVDVTKAYRFCKSEGLSFFLYHLYQSVRAVNQTAPFRLRIEPDGGVVEYDVVHPSITILRADDTFAFTYLKHQDSFELFCSEGEKVIKAAQSSSGLDWSGDTPDTIHYSSVPWVQFTSLSHARCFNQNGSIPKITFGKVFEQGERLLMPASIHVHHALVDGLDVGRHIDTFQDLLNEY